jgi:hypothetical protein
LTVKNDEARQFYETTAIEKKWTRDELVKAIQADHFGEDPTKGPSKPPKQLKRPGGEPFIYRAEVRRVVDIDMNHSLSGKNHLLDDLHVVDSWDLLSFLRRCAALLLGGRNQGSCKDARFPFRRAWPDHVGDRRS